MPIFKAKLTVTVLLEEPDEPTARALLSNVSLMGLVYEIDDGEIAGSLSVASVEPIAPECVEAELLAVNAVPNFFTHAQRVPHPDPLAKRTIRLPDSTWTSPPPAPE